MPDTFTPEQISQILEEFFKVVGTRQYIGARYVPLFGRKDEDTIEWDNAAPYEPLTVVLYQGNSYTSRQFVPVGVEITNQEFWAVTGNYNAQVEMYRRETAAAREVADNALLAANNAQGDIDTLLPKSQFGEENTVKDYIDETASSISVVIPATDFSEDNTVKDYIDETANSISAVIPASAFDENNTVKDYIDTEVGNVQTDVDTLLPKTAFSVDNTVKDYIDAATDFQSAGYMEISDAASSVRPANDIVHADNYYLHIYSGKYLDTDEIGYTGTPLAEEVAALGYVRDDGSKMMPNPFGQWSGQSGNPLGALCCGGTFLNQGVVYGRENGIMNVDTIGGQGAAMVCSDYTWAMLMGLTYNASKAVAPYNAISQYSSDLPMNLRSSLAPVDKDAWITREQAANYAANGRLFKVNAMGSNLRPGDILFNTESVEGSSGLYLDITHCAMVVAVYPELREVHVLQSGGFNHNMRYVFTTNTDTVPDQSLVGPMYCAIRITPDETFRYYAARPNWPAVMPRLKYSTKDARSVSVTSSSQVVTGFTISDAVSQFKKGALVELTIHCDDFYKLRNTSYMRILMIQGNSSSLTNYRIGRYYSFNQDIPTTVKMYGFANADYSDTNRVAFSISADVSEAVAVNLEYEINIYEA